LPSRPTLTLIGKPDCHLCDVMAAVIQTAAGDRIVLVKEDVRSRPEWSQYRFDIPILLFCDQEIARHRITEAELTQKLAALGFQL
jgi:hypothetical protein